MLSKMNQKREFCRASFRFNMKSFRIVYKVSKNYIEFLGIAHTSQSANTLKLFLKKSLFGLIARFLKFQNNTLHILFLYLYICLVFN